ncbi:hypothetical protein F5Y01DRAFT_327554, partial [Xylaria sp. FL0043]
RWDTRLWYGQIRLEHRHIRLALKYTRLQEQKYDSYLQALLAPHHDMAYSPRGEARLETHYSAYPKITTASNGSLRFLLLSTWRYYKGREKISLKKIGYLPICPHVMIDPFRIGRRYDDPDNQLEEAIEVSLWTQGNRREHTGACSRCATDFSVQSDAQSLDLCVWQDFGPEGSPGDLAWEIHCDSVGLDGVPNCWDWGHTLYHEPGTIRKLYEKYEECEARVDSASLADKVRSIFNGIGP